MEKIKEPSVAGVFYPADTVDLIRQIEFIKKSSRNFYKNTTRAVIVPHAGWVFSGKLAYEGINLLDKGIKNIFIFAPAHKVGFEGLAVSGFDKWKTPLGEIEVNQEINRELAEKFGAEFMDDAIAPEHALEVQVPFIQDAFDCVKIIPVLIGKTNPEDIEKIISEYYPDKENGFIISSDLSHFLTDENARQLDLTAAHMIETGDIRNFQYEMACGAVGITGLVEFANRNKFTLIRIGLANSSDANNDKSRVVGYGSWFLYEGEKNELIGKYHSDFVLGLCKTILESAFRKVNMTIVYPQVFDEPGASFVTLEKDGQLRGCIGSIIAHRPLIYDLIENTKNAAFKDSRFKPVTADEFDQLKFSVSILTTPRRIFFNGEEDLLNKIAPNLDGIIIKDGDKQAVFLPSVWEQLPDKRDFLNALKVKAGFTPDYFSDTLEAYRFEAMYLQDE